MLWEIQAPSIPLQKEIFSKVPSLSDLQNNMHHMVW